MLRVIFLHKFIKRGGISRSSKKKTIDLVKTPANATKERYRWKQFPDNSIPCDKFNQTHATTPCKTHAVYHFALPFLSHTQFAFDGLFFSNSYSVFAPDLFEILIDPFVPSKMQRSCTCSCINSALMVLSVPATSRYVETTDCQSVAS